MKLPILFSVCPRLGTNCRSGLMPPLHYSITPQISILAFCLVAICVVIALIAVRARTHEGRMRLFMAAVTPPLLIGAKLVLGGLFFVAYILISAESISRAMRSIPKRRVSNVAN